MKYHFHNSPVTQNSALAHNTATIVYADSGEQLKGLNELYQTILNDSQRDFNLNVIPKEKKSLVKEQFKSLPTKFDWVKNYYMYAVSAYDIEKLHLYVNKSINNSHNTETVVDLRDLYEEKIKKTDRLVILEDQAVNYDLLNRDMIVSVLYDAIVFFRYICNWIRRRMGNRKDYNC